MNNTKLQYLLVFLLSLASFLPAATSVGIFQVSEAREGVVVQHILATNNWILPLRHGVIVPSKPALFHWIGASMAQVFGDYNLLLLRLPSMLAASVMLVYFFKFAKCLLGNFHATLSVMALLTTFGFFNLAVDGRVDMIFASFVFISISIWLRNAIEVEQERRHYRDIDEITYSLVAICCGFAVLTKGPLGLALPALTIFLIAYGLWGFYGALSTIRISWVFAIALPAIWYYLAWEQGGDAFVQRHFFFENLKRFSGGAGVNQKPWWFYLSHFWGQAAPWSFLFFVPAVIKKIYQNLKQNNPTILSLVIWIASSFLLFSFSSGKRRAYLLPLLPPTILLLSIIIRDLTESYESKRIVTKLREWLEWPYERLILSFSPFLLVVFSYLLANILNTFAHTQRVKMALDAFLQTSSAHSVGACVLLLSLSTLCFLVLNFALKRRNVEYFFLAVLIINLQIVAIVLPLFSSIKSITHSMASLTELASKAVPEGERLTAIKYFKDESLDVFFYLYNRPTSILRPSQLAKLNTGYYIAPVKYLSRVNKAADSSGKIVNRLAVGKRPSDNDEESFVIFTVQ